MKKSDRNGKIFNLSESQPYPLWIREYNFTDPVNYEKYLKF